MIRVLDIRPAEDCFDESLMKEVELSEPVNETVMRRLAKSALLEYHPDFPKPYFRIEKGGCYTIQGVIGNTTFRVTASRRATIHIWKEITATIETGDANGSKT